MIRKLLQTLNIIKPQKQPQPNTIVRFEIGDRVKLSEKALSTFSGSFKDFMSKMVYQVVDKEASVMQGVRLTLHCGTTLWAAEAVKVDKDTPLRT